MGQPRHAASLGGDPVTERDPNETARMPTPGGSGEPPTEGWPGSTEGEATAPEAWSSADPPLGADAPADTVPADAVVAEPVVAEPPAAEIPPPTPTPAPTAWSPPADRRRSEPDTGRAASVVFGLVLLAVGLWFFAEQTLGLDLPAIRWSQFWPVIIIGLGVWIVLGSMRRGSR